MSQRLMFGNTPALPDGVLAAWGCRAILRGRHVDVVWDRVDAIGDGREKTLLLQHLNGAVGSRPFGELDATPVPDEQFLLFTDPVIDMWARAAGGYLYVAAWRREDVPLTALTASEAVAAVRAGKRVRMVVGDTCDDPTIIVSLQDGSVMAESVAGWSAGVVEPVCGEQSKFLDSYFDARHALTLVDQPS